MARAPVDWRTSAISLVVILVAVFTMLGINSKLAALEAKTAKLSHRVELLDNLDRRIHSIQQDVREISRARNDILDAIRQVTTSDNP